METKARGGDVTCPRHIGGTGWSGIQPGLSDPVGFVISFSRSRLILSTGPEADPVSRSDSGSGTEGQNRALHPHGHTSMALVPLRGTWSNGGSSHGEGETVAASQGYAAQVCGAGSAVDRGASAWLQTVRMLWG